LLIWRDIPDASAKYFHSIVVDLIDFGLYNQRVSKFIVDFLRERMRIEEKQRIKILHV
jgi:hypothetical protein